MPDLNMAQEGEDKIRNKQTLNTRPNEVEAGNFQVHNDLSGTCEDYLLDIEFAEITSDLDSGTSRGLQGSLLKSQLPVSGCRRTDSVGISGPSGAIVPLADCPNSIFYPTDSELHGISTHNYGCEMSVEEKWSKSTNSFAVHNFDKLEDVSGLLGNHVCSGKDDADLFLCPGFTCGETFGATVEEYSDSKTAAKDAEPESPQKEDVLSEHSNRVNSADLPTQKRPRKPTRRYVDESADFIPISKKRIPSSTSKRKILREKCVKDNQTRRKTMKLLPEESSIIPIQVPFGPLEGRECTKTNPSSAECAKKQQSTAECAKRQQPSAGCAKRHQTSPEGAKRHHSSADGSKRHQSSAESAKRYQSSAEGAKRHQSSIECVKRHTSSVARVPDSDNESSMDEWESNCATKVKSEEERARRKHHRLWTIAEVKKLIEGVDQYGVGKWSDIKSQFFLSSSHRTPVDLKDKWRNLLKASRLQSGGDKRRNLSWRPLPKSVLNRVKELATVYPYPRMLKSKVSHVQRITSAISIDESRDALPNNSRRNFHKKSST